MSCSSPRKIASNLLFDGCELIHNPLVEVDHTGMILSVRSITQEQIDRSPETEFFNGIMIPGLINAHCHIELSYLLGTIEEGKGFTHFASQIGKVRNNFSEQERLDSIVRADNDMWRGGVAGVGDISNGVSSYATKQRSTIEYYTFAELFGLATTDMSGIEPLLSYPSTSATPHSIYSLNDRLFRAIATRGDAPLSIHFMESPVEGDLYNKEGALYEWYTSLGYDIDFLHYGSPAERLVASVPSDRSILLVHNCCITQRDIDIILGHFTSPVYWVLCPSSNEYISRLSPPTDLLRQNGCNICIGTDSLASSHSLSMLEQMRALTDVPLTEILHWATHQGAKALGMDMLGDIKVGKRPSINILSSIDYDNMSLTPRSKITRIL